MLKLRVLTAAVLVPLVLAALFLLPPTRFALITLIAIAVGAQEWARLTGLARAGAAVYALLVGGSGVVLVIANAGGLAQGWPDAIVYTICGAAALFWLVAVPLWLRGRWSTRRPGPVLALGLLVLLGAWVALVELQARSAWLALAAMAIVWIADTAAYFSGRAFGRRKLAPAVSPGKTWEGVYGGCAAVAVYALLLVPFASAAGMGGDLGVAGVAAWVAFALLIAAVSIMGDLFESLLKRNAGAKDSGRVLPGHGGVLDRIDALLAALPLAGLAAHLVLARSVV